MTSPRSGLPEESAARDLIVTVRIADLPEIRTALGDSLTEISRLRSELDAQMKHNTAIERALAEKHSALCLETERRETAELETKLREAAAYGEGYGQGAVDWLNEERPTVANIRALCDQRWVARAKQTNRSST